MYPQRAHSSSYIVRPNHINMAHARNDSMRQSRTEFERVQTSYHAQAGSNLQQPVWRPVARPNPESVTTKGYKTKSM